MNKKDGKFNFLYDICHQIQCIFNHCRFIANPKKTLKKKKKLHYLINGEFHQKVHIPKHAELNVLSDMLYEKFLYHQSISPNYDFSKIPNFRKIRILNSASHFFSVKVPFHIGDMSQIVVVGWEEGLSNPLLPQNVR